jgi:organic radical activating enzyme
LLYYGQIRLFIKKFDWLYGADHEAPTNQLNIKKVKKNKLEFLDIYQEADLIVQVTGKCNKKCATCYDLLGILKGELVQETYLHSINDLKKGAIIVLRGGEPTIVVNWFEKFVAPAINKGLRVIIETNGYFISENDYSQILSKLTCKNIFVRISFDKSHTPNKTDFSKMAFFAKEATKLHINFAFYSLGINKEEIINFIQRTELELYVEKFHSLIYYREIYKVPLKGKYLRADGKMFLNINSKRE